MYAGVTRLPLDEVRAAVSASKAFANDLGRETEICRAFRAAQV